MTNLQQFLAHRRRSRTPLQKHLARAKPLAQPRIPKPPPPLRQPETLAEMQERLQRAVDHGWRPQGELPEGVTLVIPDN